MTSQTPSRTPDCTPPADPGSAAVVAHASESSSGAGTKSSDKPTCRRGTCPAHRICLACEAPMDLSSLLRASESDAPTLEQFQRWLENKAHNSAAVISATEPRFSWSGDAYLDHSLVIAECRVATSLLMQFKQEQGA